MPFLSPPSPQPRSVEQVFCSTPSNRLMCFSFSTMSSLGSSTKQMLDLPPPSLQPRNIDRILVLPTIALLALQATFSIRSTITIIRSWTIYRLFPKQDVPHIFQDSSTVIIIHLGFHQPFAYLYIDVFLMFADGGSRNRKLGAACCGYGLRDRERGE